MRTYYPVIAIAGSDSSGGAGIQADIKTISAIGCYAMTAITAITAQNTKGVTDIQTVNPQIVARQIETTCNDIAPLAVKTGMLVNEAIITTVADTLKRLKMHCIVVDPVMISSSGTPLLEHDAVDVMVERMFPISTLVTPNINEAISLTGESDPDRQARRLFEMGCNCVLLKGGDNDSTECHKIDYLAYRSMPNKLIEFKSDTVHTVNTHGTGCTLSSAIASYLALGYGLQNAVAKAKAYISRALQSGADVNIGAGHGPMNHFFKPEHLKSYNPKS